MEPASQHPDPAGEAMSRSTRLAAQLISLSVAAAQGFVVFRARRAAIQAARDEQELQALLDQERRAAQQARLAWAPALDRKWLTGADLLQTARAWSAAMPVADTETSAATAMRAAEDRLRTLHPYAMTRYDRLRSDGLPPADAMVGAATFFASSPYAREGSPARPHAAIHASAETPASQPGPPAGTAPEAGSGTAIAVRAPGPYDKQAAEAVALASQSFPAPVTDALSHARDAADPGQQSTRRRPAIQSPRLTNQGVGKVLTCCSRGSSRHADTVR